MEGSGRVNQVRESGRWRVKEGEWEMESEGRRVGDGE